MDACTVLPLLHSHSLDYNVLIIGPVAQDDAGVLLDLALTGDVDKAAAIVRDEHFVVAGHALVIDGEKLLLLELLR